LREQHLTAFIGHRHTQTRKDKGKQKTLHISKLREKYISPSAWPSPQMGGGNVYCGGFTSFVGLIHPAKFPCLSCVPWFNRCFSAFVKASAVAKASVFANQASTGHVGGALLTLFFKICVYPFESVVEYCFARRSLRLCVRYKSPSPWPSAPMGRGNVLCGGFTSFVGSIHPTKFQYV